MKVIEKLPIPFKDQLINRKYAMAFGFFIKHKRSRQGVSSFESKAEENNLKKL